MRTKIYRCTSVHPPCQSRGITRSFVEEGVDEFVRLERCEVGDSFAETNQFHGDAELSFDREAIVR
jgi:hypothetical protein